MKKLILGVSALVEGKKKGLLIGTVSGLVGFVAGILKAPVSGKETREKIAEKSLEKKDETLEKAEEAREKAKEAKEKASDKVEKVKEKTERVKKE